MTDLARLEIHAPRATLTLNRPDARNALSREMLAALHDRAGALEEARDVHVVRLRGEGGAFCAGMDLKEVTEDPTAARGLLDSLARLTIRIRRLPMVVVGEITGAAIGGGCGLACVCDLSVTHADAKLGFPEVDLGLCPAVVAPWVVRRVGGGRARRILLGGGTLSGAEAHELGLVSDLVRAREEMGAGVEEVVDRIAAGGPRALRETKGLLNELDGSLEESLVLRGAALSAEVLASTEAQDRLRARFATR